MNPKTPDRIRSSKEALHASHHLPSYWSRETLLTQRILIYITELLEKQAIRKRRNPTAWQIHVGNVLRGGGTIQEAAKKWRTKK